ncbi:hypothetical protein DPEC_G00344810 [Dallia pectoralis]|uniref:Uncharacterized protein n=1 Tax=Dallia pectoralis TaxID=75939 RepID=A0ACC2F3C9_DALPE|nr:hypothetical protein DPEC_G00344810 [Dallia pectoralis]
MFIAGCSARVYAGTLRRIPDVLSSTELHYLTDEYPFPQWAPGDGQAKGRRLSEPDQWKRQLEAATLEQVQRQSSSGMSHMGERRVWDW